MALKDWFKRAGEAATGITTGPAIELAEKATELFVKAGEAHTGRREFRLKMEEIASATLHKTQAMLFDFFLSYEGRASELPQILIVLRGSVRPVLTYALAGFWLWSYWYTFTHTNLTADQQQWLGESQALLFKLNLLSLGFWYGEKLLTRSGLVDIFRKRDLDT